MSDIHLLIRHAVEILDHSVAEKEANGDRERVDPLRAERQRLADMETWV